VSPSPAPVPGQLSTGGTRCLHGADWQPLWFSRPSVIGLCRDHFGVEATGAVLLTDGMLNQSWRIAADDHDRVLRIGRRERTVEQVTYERVAARMWSAVAPQVVVAESARVPVVDDRTLTLFPFVDGSAGTAVDGPLRARALTPLIARMHRVSLDVALPQRPGFTAIDDEPRWFGWAQTRLAMTERFGAGREVTAPIETVDRATGELDDLLDGWRHDGRLDLRATVHGDLNARNQLYQDGRLVGLIDTDDCRVEPLIWDVANIAFSVPTIDPAVVWRDYLAAGGPLDARDDDLLVHFARIGALTALMWLTDDSGPTERALADLTALADRLTRRAYRDG
jgi:Ser/Thr protein kinase RdoA (MazF antagonist)